MEDLLKPIYQTQVNKLNTLGVVILEKIKPISPITDNFDVILLIVVRESEQPWHMKHYEISGKIAAMHIVTEELLLQWCNESRYHRVLEWIINGKIIEEHDTFITHLKNQLLAFPKYKRDLRKAIEFGKLIKSYNEAKDLYESSQFKDAYSSMVHSLHYLARLAVIEEGIYPGVTVWNQVKQTDLEVYKLYEELIQSNEEIEQRIQLMLIAMDFVISTRAKSSANHLLNIMQTRNTTWTYEELRFHSSISPYATDLTAMIFYLTEKEIIETLYGETKEKGVFKRRYQTKE